MNVVVHAQLILTNVTVEKNIVRVSNPKHVIANGWSGYCYHYRFNNDTQTQTQTHTKNMKHLTRSDIWYTKLYLCIFQRHIWVRFNGRYKHHGLSWSERLYKIIYRTRVSIRISTFHEMTTAEWVSFDQRYTKLWISNVTYMCQYSIWYFRFVCWCCV